MKIKTAIITVVAIPLLLAIGVSAQLIYEEVKIVNKLESLSKHTQLSVIMSNLVHEQQKERGATAVFLGSNGQNFKAELALQREDTNKRRKIFLDYMQKFDNAAYGTDFTNDIDIFLKDLSKLDDVRSQVDDLSITLPKAVGYYTSLNNQILGIISDLAHLSINAEVTNYFNAYANFIKSKERAGIERAVGAVAFGKGYFSSKNLDKFKELITIQDIYIDAFLAVAAPEQKDFYSKTMSEKAVDEVNRMRKIAIDSSFAYAMGPQQKLGVDARYWFEQATAKINLLKKIEDRLASDLINKKEEVISASKVKKAKYIAITVISIVITIIISSMITRSINQSFSQMVSSMNNLAKGNIEIELPPETNNEMGEMAKALRIFKENKINADRLAEEQKQEQYNQIERGKKIEIITKDFENSVSDLVNGLAAASTELDATAQSMSGIAKETTEQTKTMSSASASTSDNIQTVAKASEGLSESIRELSQQVQNTSQAANSAASDVGRAAEQIEGLLSASEKIGTVVSLIQDIAEQTNLLALNATIESARAGEAGKGFAVVASEVKSLAQETSKATEQIAEEVNAVQNEVRSAVDAIKNIDVKIRDVNTASSAIAAAIEEQNATTEEIMRNTQTSAISMQELNGNVASVDDAAQTTGNAADDVLSASSELGRQTDILKQKVAEFLENVKSV